MAYWHGAALRSDRDAMIWTLFADEFTGSPAAQVQAQAFDALGAGIPLEMMASS